MKRLLILLILLPLFSQAQDWPILGTKDWHDWPTKDLNDTCDVIPLGVDFGACSMALGWALTDSGCVVLSGCGWIGSDGINYSSSFFSSSYECNSACLQDTVVFLNCIDSNLIDPSIFCTQVYDPVCGCDSVTYQNQCVATFMFGVSSFYPGVCATNKVPIHKGSAISVFPNPSAGLFQLDQLPKDSKIACLDLFGHTVFQTISSQKSIQIDLNFLPKGLYLLTVNGSFAEKILIE